MKWISKNAEEIAVCTMLVFLLCGFLVSCSCSNDKPKVSTVYPATNQVPTLPSDPNARVTAPAPPKFEALRYDPPVEMTADHAYKKSSIEGTIYTVEYFSNGPYGNSTNRDTDGNEKPSEHLVPDYTTVTYDPCGDDNCRNETIDFCGNLLDHFNPNQKIKMIVRDSKLSDYNGCHTIEVVELTFGGKGLSSDRWGPANPSRVPGTR